MRRTALASSLAVALALAAVPPSRATDAAAPAAQAAFVSSVPADAGPAPWSHLDFPDTGDAFHFAIVGDRTAGARPGVFEDAMAKLGLLRPAFVLTVGDLIEGDSPDPAELARQWDEVERTIGQLPAPFFFVPGNHDYDTTVPSTVEAWRTRRGPDYYSFVHRNVLFICLNSESPRRGEIGPDQVDFVMQQVIAYPRVRWTFVLLHQPLWLSGRAAGWAEVEATLAGQPHTVIAGHWHAYQKSLVGDRAYYVTATTGGDSRLQGPGSGTFDHVLWVTVGEGAPTFANIAPGAIYPDDLVVQEADVELVDMRERVNVLCTPLAAGEGAFTEGTVRLSVVNGLGRQVDVQVRADGGAGLAADPSVADLVAAAGETATAEIGVAAIAQGADASALSCVLHWVATSEGEGGRRLTSGGAFRVSPVPLHPCPAAPGGVAIDGLVADWPDLPVAFSDPSASEPDHSDLVVRLGAVCDDDYLYLAVAVENDLVTVDPDRRPWEQDGIMLRLDARPDPGRSCTHGGREFIDHVLVATAPGPDGTPTAAFHTYRLPPGTLLAHRAAGNAHVLEVAVPARYLDAVQGAPWQAFRLSVQVHDQDGDQGHWPVLWTPAWSSAEDVVGSGTFVHR